MQLPPGSTIGILGGGQLGRMMAIAAAEMGYYVHVFCPERDCPAAEVARYSTYADYHDEAALKDFANSVDVVTLEFENVPLQAANMVASLKPLHPAASVLAICQHRVKEKDFITSCGFKTAPYAPVKSLADLETAIRKIGTPAILKTSQLGYDGKGQVKINNADEAQNAWSGLKSDDAILEGFVAFEKEISVIVARNSNGQTMCYPAVENIHKHHILHQTIAPARVDVAVAKEAERIAGTLAEKLALIGILAVEMFVCKDGSILINELAPRPHNSGHWTIDACLVSQFEMVIRAVCGLNLPDIGMYSKAIMTNLIGDDIRHWESLVQKANTRVHLYGKKESRPGRKMGHATELLK